jgi:uncharacterized damage-inducible protein DinB
VPDPLLAEAGEIVARHLESIRAVVRGASAEMLNARPAGPDSNPPAVIVMHVAASTRHWLHVAVGATPPPRDRDAEFRTVVDGPDELLAFVDRVDADVRSLLSGAGDLEPTALREAAFHDEDVTAAWALLHALEHLGEHVGHLGLTRQLWDARAGST